MEMCHNQGLGLLQVSTYKCSFVILASYNNRCYLLLLKFITQYNIVSNKKI